MQVRLRMTRQGVMMSCLGSPACPGPGSDHQDPAHAGHSRPTARPGYKVKWMIAAEEFPRSGLVWRVVRCMD